MGGIEPARVVQVWIQDSTEADNNKYGSGYLLTSRLVLTSAHVAQKVGDTAQVFFSYLAPAAPSEKRGSVPGQVIRSVREKTRQKGDDLALVLLNQETDLYGKVFPPDFGLLPTSGENIPVKALGFPDVQNYPDTQNAEEITGDLGLVPTQDNLHPLHINSSTPEQVTTGSAWAGMSGAPVFYKHLLIGIVKQHPPRFGNHRLDISPIRFLAHDKKTQTIWPSDGPNFVDIREDFIYTLSEGGVPFRIGAPHTQWDPENAKIPSLMLNPRYGLVPFVGRKETLKELEKWCLENGQTDELAFRLVRGPGGTGKTRLAKELCTKMAAQGWDTWRLSDDPRSQATASSSRIFSLQRHTLLVVDDYADAHTDLLAAIRDWHTRSPSHFRFRVLLVARDRGIWAEDLLQKCPEIKLLWPETNDITLGDDDTSLSPKDQIEHFTAASRAFLKYADTSTEQAPATPPTPSFTSPAYTSPLFIHIAALLRAYGEPIPDNAPDSHPENPDNTPESTEELLDAILRREKKHWDSPPYSDRDRKSQNRMMIAATLPGAPSQNALARLLEAVPGLETEASNQQKLAGHLLNLYPAKPQGLAPIEPDLLTEHLVAKTLKEEEKEDPGEAARFLSRLLTKTTTDTQTERLLTVLTRAAKTPTLLNSPVKNTLSSLLHDNFSTLFKQAKQQVDNNSAGITNSTLPRILTEACKAAPNPELAIQYADKIPHPSLNFTPLALTLTQTATTLYRQLAADNPDAYLPNLAMSLNNLANRLSEMGDRQGALHPAEEATDLYRQLATDNPDAYLPNLAASLNTLANRLSGMGDHQSALHPAQEATDLYRQLATDNPDAYLNNLAASLNNLAIRLSEMGDRQGALHPAQEATKIRRQLATDNPDAYLPDLAASLNNLAIRLSEMGDRQGALHHAQEATKIRRQLATDNPDAYLPDLAMSLNNLAIRLSEMGDHQSALRSAEEATDLYRQLATDNPDAYLPDLAMSLNNLANRLSEMGDRQGAFHSVQEATDLYRQLAADNPDAYLPDLAGSLHNLAMSLHNLANRLSEMGDRQGAFHPAQEATNLYRQLATDNPDAYLNNLAASLNNLANRLSEMGDPKGAREKAVESIRLLLPFAEQLPARFGALLAISALTYREACEASGGEADEELLAQVAAVLRGGS